SAPIAIRSVPGAVQRNSSAPIGTPRTPPIRNGARRRHWMALRSFHTETPCTISPKDTISAAAWVGGRKCNQTAAATIAKAKPAKPVTNAAANAPAVNNVRSRVCNWPMAYPMRSRRADAARDGATLGLLQLRGGCLDLFIFGDGPPGSQPGVARDFAPADFRESEANNFAVPKTTLNELLHPHADVKQEGEMSNRKHRLGSATAVFVFASTCIGLAYTAVPLVVGSAVAATADEKAA